jgi:hypothetical protein|tara:strand:- start:2073 stop:2447 length:375 start_codon:yes stop_codon:yes gene_type:complete
MDTRELLKAARQHDAYAVPAHPGRFGIGLTEYIQQGETFDDVRIVERLNGGSRQGENERAWELCDDMGYLGVGGSDAHLTSHIGACLTKFSTGISTEAELVEALLSEQFQPVWLKDATNGTTGE